MQYTRAQRTRIHSAYTREQPPPDEPPLGVTEVTAWQLASAQWRKHLPDALLGVECIACRSTWPCDAWEIANDMLNDCRAAAGRR
ncbi:MAG: hypothetical protein ACRDXX_13555 [Stackebrandtia sp.]